MAASKKTTAKAKTARKDMSAIKEPMTKSALLATLAENTQISKKQAGMVVTELAGIIERHLKKGGAGTFTLPGLLKIKTVTKSATKARKGINPFTGAEMTFKAKPARNVVRVTPLKALKSMV